MPDSESATSTVRRFRPAAYLTATGEDAADFLQSQWSQDLRRVENSPAYGLWLDHRGRVLADSILWKTGDDAYAIFSYYSPAEIIRNTLEKHIIADDVLLEDHTEDVLLLCAPHRISGELESLVSFPSFRLGPPWIDRLVPRQSAASPRNAIGTSDGAGPETLLDHYRIKRGFFQIPEEIQPKDTPLDLGLEQAVCFTKGCFLGQEVVARAHRLGRSAWKPVVLEASGNVAIRTPTGIGGETPFLRITSWCADEEGSIGLGLARGKRLERLICEGVTLEDAGETHVTITPLIPEK